MKKHIKCKGFTNQRFMIFKLAIKCVDCGKVFEHITRRKNSKKEICSECAYARKYNRIVEKQKLRKGKKKNEMSTV